MKILKLAFFIFLLLFLYNYFNHHGQIHFPGTLVRPSQEQLQAQVEFLEEKIKSMKQEIVNDNECLARAAAPHASCGATITAENSTEIQCSADAKRLEGEISESERELEEARQKLSASRETQ